MLGVNSLGERNFEQACTGHGGHEMKLVGEDQRMAVRFVRQVDRKEGM